MSTVPLVMAIDAGTTGVRCLLMSEPGSIVASGYATFPQHFPRPGWVEHDPEEIWQACIQAATQACAQVPRAIERVTAVGITNQRETLVFWDPTTLVAPRRAIVWQDRRSAAYCDQLRASGVENTVMTTTGLRLDPYFTATRFGWLAYHDPDLWHDICAGRVRVGTVDTYLIARLSGGDAYLTDPSNASRTLLADVTTGQWSPQMCDLFAVPPAALATIVPSWGTFAQVHPASFLGVQASITAVVGDQQSSLFAQGCHHVGEAKCTYGTGSFVLAPTDSAAMVTTAHRSGLVGTIGWQAADGTLTHALEGSIFVTGSAVQWLRDGLGLVDDAAQSEVLAKSVSDTAGVMIVPALTGLGAPWWDAEVTGTVVGLTRGTTRAHLVRAVLESIAYQVRAVVDAFAQAGTPITQMSVDGGAAENNFLMQFQADELTVPVRRGPDLELTGMGAALMSGIGAGLWDVNDVAELNSHLSTVFNPSPGHMSQYERWLRAVKASRSWSS